MKFTVSTKPLMSGINLGIVGANVSKFYQKSTLAQVYADQNTLKINLEATSILSEIRLKGSGDESEPHVVLVDCMLLKQLISTFDTSTVTFEFIEGGLVLHSGKSKFTLPQVLSSEDVELKAPDISKVSGDTIGLNKADWKFVKEYQMHAIAISFVHPAYTRVWVGDSGEVLVGDMDNSIFTYSDKSKLGRTCLLTDTIINLFNNLPEDTKLIPLGRSYAVNVVTDGYEFISEFTPDYEEDEGIGDYNSQIIIGLMNIDENSAVRVNISPINKALGQAALLSSSTEDTVSFEVNNNAIHLHDSNIDCIVPLEGTNNLPYSIEFKTSLLKSVVANSPEEIVYISPAFTNDEISGIVVKSKELTTVLGGVD